MARSDSIARIERAERLSRVGLHRKQERIQIKEGVPTVRELREGVPALRTTTEGLVEYVRFGNDLYKKVLERVL